MKLPDILTCHACGGLKVPKAQALAHARQEHDYGDPTNAVTLEDIFELEAQ